MGNFWTNYFNPGALVFDIGANRGETTAFFLSAGAGLVIAVEPQPAMVSVLRQRFHNNKSVIVEERAIGDHAGTIPLYTCEFDTLATTHAAWTTDGRFKLQHWQKSENVALSTLDEMIDAYGEPEYIKIDVEGAELAVLHGLTSSVKSISFEYTGEFTKQVVDCIGWLETIGSYRYWRTIGEVEQHFDAAAIAKFLDSQLPANAFLDVIINEMKANPAVYGNLYARRIDNMGKQTAYGVSDWLGYLRHAEIDAIKKYISVVPVAANVVNIGAGGGTSALSVLEARPDVILTTVDINQTGPLGSLDGERNVLNSAGMTNLPNYTQILGDSKLVGAKWSKGIDAVLIDGDHSYDGASGDLNIWGAHLKIGGLMFVHDYEAKHWPTVKAAVDDFVAGGGWAWLELADTMAVLKKEEKAIVNNENSSPAGQDIPQTESGKPGRRQRNRATQ